MDSRRPLILISNDDGYMAKGINELVKFVKPLGDVVVVAPDSARSGSSCALSVHEPLHFKCLTKEEGLTVYRCSGTPADCVKLSKNTILDRKPDLILSGINHGDNSSINVHNSGTMGAVIEGCLSGIPSIGFSLCDHSEEADFTPLAHHIVEISKMVLQKGLPALTCLNVNFPKQDTFNGVRVCEQAKGRWSDEFDPCPRQHDPNYYWLAGKFLEQEPNNEKNDHWALAHGYVAITPVTVDMTAYDYIETLSSYCKAID